MGFCSIFYYLGPSGAEDDDYEESQGMFTFDEICDAVIKDGHHVSTLPTEVSPENVIIDEVGWELEETYELPIIETSNIGKEEATISDNEFTSLQPVTGGFPEMAAPHEDFTEDFHSILEADNVSYQNMVVSSSIEVPFKAALPCDRDDDSTQAGIECSSLPEIVNHSGLTSVLRERNPVTISKSASKQQSKMNRVLGQPYIGFRRKDKGSTKKIMHDVDREGRKMGPPCESLMCRKWAKRSCELVTQSDREVIFNDFWKKMTSWEEKKTYVCSTVSIEPTKQKTVNGKPSRRTSSYFYNLKIQDRRFPVCRAMYLSTLGLKRAELHYWLSNFQLHNVPSGRGLQSQLFNRVQQESSPEDFLPLQHVPQPAEKLSKIEFKQAMDYLNRFLDALPTLPSHYCRKSSNKLYLQTDIRSWSQLYEIYKARCVEDNAKLVSKFSFRRIRKGKNIDVHQPKKDRCDVCCSFELGHISQEIYDAHQLNKESARQEKENDKAKAMEGSCHVLCFDLMMVQPLPRLKAASAYYKLKLTAHCYTVYNMKTHDCMAYWFDESQATLNATTFASCLRDYLEELLDEASKQAKNSKGPINISTCLYNKTKRANG
ncbi:hypothetical protein GE061_010095 [Apolygus lucorum]|uniref:Uncharacterized protein n=1 Tax=Apolygus lucorum TaxID=248454 RepID=A0A8S9Y2D1_APOLU|nr:hypothetical protein GE061_010095 [Apolygus lucorum]